MNTQFIETGEVSKPQLTSWSIDGAMRDLYDLGERIQCFPILLGEVARQIVDDPDPWFSLKVEKIEWGLRKSQLTAEVISLFKTWKFEENRQGYMYFFEGVPVQIVIIKNKYKFFERPDTKYYKTDEFKLANPFESYWKVRNLIK